MSAVDAAYGKVEIGLPNDGLALLEAAGQRDDISAIVELANWYLRGDIIERDVRTAREYLRRASILGNADAALAEAALAANGSGGEVDWPAAMSQLRHAAGTSAIAAAQLSTLERMALDPDGAPIVVPKLRRISKTPAIWRVEGLLTQEECRQIATTATDLLEPATVIDPTTGRNVVHPVRTSDTALIGPTYENLVIRALNRRLATLTETLVAQGEALTVLRYSPGQRFRPHLDALPDTCNQRVKTVLVYLNDSFTGGTTIFPHAGLRITPRAGDAIVFDNVDADERSTGQLSMRVKLFLMV